MTGMSVRGLDLYYRHYLLARAEQVTFPLVFESFCNCMNWAGFPSIAYIEITRSGNAAVGHLFMFIGEDEKTMFLNINPQIRRLCL